MASPADVTPEHPDMKAWRAADEVAVDIDKALAGWAASAHDVLAETAHVYGAFLTQAELAARVQADTGVKAGGPVRVWIDSLLARVTESCHAAAEPPLTALCVRLDQTVGDAYLHVLRVAGLPRPDDLDMHAAFARFQCYQHFGATIPADGGPVLTPRVADKRKGRGAAVKAAPAKAGRPAPSARTPKDPAARPRKAAKAAPAKPEPPKPKLCPNCFTELTTQGICGYCNDF
ncbi:hypothetical protein [Tsukamurella soli]|uniref:Uncharacterized protein n=1 Tax=Tsukamurella soli TaxID=644556 RepID=A0ABP8KE37_9ACTN